MSQLVPSQLPFQNSSTAFAAELSAVDAQLVQGFDSLYPPLLGLVRAQAKQAKPHLRAALVLAIAVPSGPDKDSEDLRQKRIYLAAALEMLYIALQVHQILLQSKVSELHDTVDKSVMGSTILAGDTCFSHAALLAARTDNPQVVAIFSESLQTISEKQLRTLFSLQGSKQTFDPSQELFRAGLQAACTLANLDATLHDSFEQLIEELDAQLLHRKIIPSSLVQMLDPLHQERWHALADWYNPSTA